MNKLNIPISVIEIGIFMQNYLQVRFDQFNAHPLQLPIIAF